VEGAFQRLRISGRAALVSDCQNTTCESRDSNPDGLPHWILTGARDLLLPKQVNTLTNYYILPDSGGKPGVGAGVSRHQCRTLQEETHPQTHPAIDYDLHPSVQLERPRTPSTPSLTMIGNIAMAATGSAHHQPSKALRPTPAKAMTDR
jgi:hypothetical protein